MPRTKQFDKEEVLDKAVHLFWEKGYNATSMEDLVNTLGINRASMYATFGSKHGLFSQAIQKYKDAHAKKVADFLYYQLNVRQGLYTLFENLVNSALSDETRRGCMIVNTTTELANCDSELCKKLQDNKEAFETIFYNYLKYGVDQGQISSYKDIKSIAFYLYVMQSGIQVVSKIEVSKEELMKTVSSTLSILD